MEKIPSSIYLACFYRVSIKAVVVIDSTLLLVRESSSRWDLPGGGVEHGEDLETALARELNEELGLEGVSYDNHNLELWFSYDHDPGWERPNLNIIVTTHIFNLHKGLSAGKKVEYHWFTRDEIEALPLEKNIENHRKNLIKRAFGN